MATLPNHDPLENAARPFLGNAFLVERAVRIGHLTRWISDFVELRDLPCNRRAVWAAAWFQDAWCLDELRAGRLLAPLVLTVQPDELQRSRAADWAGKQLRGVVDEPTRGVAVRTIREAGRRETIMTEAQILAEATNLDSMGPLWLYGQLARGASGDRSLGTIVAAWERQVEYHYWDGRIADTLRFARTRELARHRCAALDACMIALRDQLACGDRHVAPNPSGKPT